MSGTPKEDLHPEQIKEQIALVLEIEGVPQVIQLIENPSKEMHRDAEKARNVRKGNQL